MKSLRIAAIQLTSTAEWAENLAMVKKWVGLAAQDGARLVVLPENVFLFSGKAMRSLADSSAQIDLLEEVRQLAVRHAIYLVVGSHPLSERPTGENVPINRVRQSCLVFSPAGELVKRYDKIHLFDVAVSDKAGAYKESTFIEPGDVDVTDIESQIIDVDGFKVGLSICYDVRFPELYRVLSHAGADVLLVPAAFTYVTGKMHWSILLAARAIENQCFVLGVNQCGWHNKTRQTYGHSALYSPTGECLAGLEEEAGYFVYEINDLPLSDCREKMPCLSHRRI